MTYIPDPKELPTSEGVLEAHINRPLANSELEILSLLITNPGRYFSLLAINSGISVSLTENTISGALFDFAKMTKESDTWKFHHLGDKYFGWSVPLIHTYPTLKHVFEGQNQIEASGDNGPVNIFTWNVRHKGEYCHKYSKPMKLFYYLMNKENIGNRLNRTNTGNIANRFSKDTLIKNVWPEEDREIVLDSMRVRVSQVRSVFACLGLGDSFTLDSIHSFGYSFKISDELLSELSSES